MSRKGLFIGLITLDFIYLVDKYPQQNQKIVASDYTVAAGGPATNAGVTFQYLGNQTLLMGVLGEHPMTQLIKNDLSQIGLIFQDLDPSYSDSPPVSSIIVSKPTGDRAVISINATKSQAKSQEISPQFLSNIDIILIDGHQIEVSENIAKLAQAQNTPIILDGGSWKPGLEKILPYINYALCSENFYPPHCQNEKEVFAYLSGLGIPYIAITHGEKEINYQEKGEFGSIAVPQINAIDTLGAGDIFHGAFCHYIRQETFTQALASSAQIASFSCQHFGTRLWMRV
jgi:sugar/nucleoside kinase (ribokinase family)